MIHDQLSVFGGACFYEFRMQARRSAVWNIMLLLGLLMAGLMTRIPGLGSALINLHGTPILPTLVYWANIVNYILPVALAVLVADRLPRDQRTHVQELLNTLPSTLNARLFGKFLGSTLATLTPLGLFYLLGTLYILLQTHDLMVLPLALLAFAALVVPGALFVGAFSTALPALIWVPLYQFLFLIYWFWGNLYQPRGIPTLSTTILTPAGGYMSRGFFGTTIFPIAHASTFDGLLSLLLLLLEAILVILALGSYLRWRQTQQ